MVRFTEKCAAASVPTRSKHLLRYCASNCGSYKQLRKGFVKLTSEGGPVQSSVWNPAADGLKRFEVTETSDPRCYCQTLLLLSLEFYFGLELVAVLL
jgi:hypothetical protein